ncbi:MAG TPA: hemerythrin domain-containing protein [Kofleriaceae bacterium]
MHEDHDQLDHELARLAESLRAGDHMLGCLRLAEFALKLDHYIRREERALSFAAELVEVTRPSALAIVHREHSSLRQLVAAIATALDRADDRRGIELVGKLRSVLLVHVAKEEMVFHPAMSHAVH